MASAKLMRSNKASRPPRNSASNNGNHTPDERSLDPENWEQARAVAHQALDHALDFLESVRDRPVWRSVPEPVRKRLMEPLPTDAQELEATLLEFEKLILPYATGNVHPRFFGWVHGTGTLAGVLAEMFAASMNSNCGGRDHGAVYVERCVIEWCKQAFGLPKTASGVLVSGTSMGTVVALTVARNAAADWDIRREGTAGGSKKLVAYTSQEGHESIAKALELLGLGHGALRRVQMDEHFRIDLRQLRVAIARDRAAGFQPFCVIGTAGTVNTGAIDDLAGLAQIAKDERLWFHADGAFGGLCVLSKTLRPRLKGIELADSLAFDFHKWMHVPYDAGCVLVRDGEKHWQTFTTRPSYLQGAERGLSGGGRWFCEYGPELSRGFRALKVWFTLKTYGARALGDSILQNCRQAEYLAGLVRREPRLELLAPAELNIVCFRYRPRGFSETELDDLNENLVEDLHEQGVAAPSTTRIGGKLAVRVNITNHRTRREDLSLLVKALLEAGRTRVRRKPISRRKTLRRV